MTEICFEFPQTGKLALEHTFYVLDGKPILFVCIDKQKRRWLCSCCCMYREWLIGRTSEEALLEMIDDTIPIRDVFEKHCDKKFFVRLVGKQLHVEKEIPDDAFPMKGAKLELERAKTGAYCKSLEKAKEITINVS